MAVMMAGITATVVVVVVRPLYVPCIRGYSLDPSPLLYSFLV